MLPNKYCPEEKSIKQVLVDVMLITGKEKRALRTLTAT